MSSGGGFVDAGRFHRLMPAVPAGRTHILSLVVDSASKVSHHCILAWTKHIFYTPERLFGFVEGHTDHSMGLQTRLNAGNGGA
jgi:hypothetical protein